MNNSRNLFFSTLLTLGLAIGLSAQSKPNFTGTWKLNVAKSNLGGAPIDSLTVVVDHKEPVFTYTAKAIVNGQEFDETATVQTDGTPGKDAQGANIVCHWDGAVLVTEGTAADGTALYQSRMSLSAEGKTVTRDYERKGDQEPQKRHEIYDKN